MGLKPGRSSKVLYFTSAPISHVHPPRHNTAEDWLGRIDIKGGFDKKLPLGLLPFLRAYFSLFENFINETYVDIFFCVGIGDSNFFLNLNHELMFTAGEWTLKT